MQMWESWVVWPITDKKISVQNLCWSVWDMVGFQKLGELCGRAAKVSKCSVRL